MYYFARLVSFQCAVASSKGSSHHVRKSALLIDAESLLLDLLLIKSVTSNLLRVVITIFLILPEILIRNP